MQNQLTGDGVILLFENSRRLDRLHGGRDIHTRKRIERIVQHPFDMLAKMAQFDKLRRLDIVVRQLDGVYPQLLRFVTNALEIGNGFDDGYHQS